MGKIWIFSGTAHFKAVAQFEHFDSSPSIAELPCN